MVLSLAELVFQSWVFRDDADAVSPETRDPFLRLYGLIIGLPLFALHLSSRAWRAASRR